MVTFTAFEMLGGDDHDDTITHVFAATTGILGFLVAMIWCSSSGELIT